MMVQFTSMSRSSLPEQSNSTLLSVPLAPLSQRPNTRANQHDNTDFNDVQKPTADEISIVFTAVEWRNVFSRTNKKMKDN